MDMYMYTDMYMYIYNVFAEGSLEDKLLNCMKWPPNG